MWVCARIDFTNSNKQVLALLNEFASYERLIEGLPAMQQKNIVILLWTYSRDSRLTSEESCQFLIEKCLDALLQYQTQFFKMDNFDILLLV